MTDDGLSGLTVADRIRDYILAGNLGEGSRLPSERRLAELLGIGRAQVRSAYRELESTGTVKTISPRIRVVAATERHASDLLAGSIAVLTHLPAAAASQTPSGDQHHALFVGVAHAMQAAGVGMIVLSPDRLDNRALAGILRARPQGVISIGRSTETTAGVLFLERLRAAGVPVAIGADSLEAGALRLLTVDAVSTDHALGARLLVEHLHAKGCRRVAMQVISRQSMDSDRCWYRQRREGFLRACEELGLEPINAALPRHPHVAAASARERFEQTVRMLVDPLRPIVTGPDAADGLMLLSDGAHCEVAMACRILGRQPNREICITGYDNYWPMCSGRCFEATPPTATVDKGDDRVGEKLVELILGRAKGTLGEEPERQVVPSRLVVTAEQAIDAHALARSITR